MWEPRRLTALCASKACYWELRVNGKDVGRCLHKKEFPSKITQILPRAKVTGKSISRPSTQILGTYWSVGWLAKLCSHGLLCYAMLCYAMLCYAMLCYAMLCYATRDENKHVHMYLSVDPACHSLQAMGSYTSSTNKWTTGLKFKHAWIHRWSYQLAAIMDVENLINAVRIGSSPWEQRTRNCRNRHTTNSRNLRNGHTTNSRNCRNRHTTNSRNCRNRHIAHRFRRKWQKYWSSQVNTIHFYLQ
jgi:hypothetical protein